MMTDSQDYNLFYKFIETFSRDGFKGMDPLHPLMVDLDRMMEENNQFFYVGDILQMRFHYVDKRSLNIMGIDAEELSPYHFFEATHPDDMPRHTLGRAKLFKLAHDLYMAEKGTILFSTNFKIRNPQGTYTELLFQMYLYFSTIPYKSVFLLKVHTNIDWFKKRKYGYHYYIGNNLSNFRYPDEELLALGNILSNREMEIVRLIESGLVTEQIAEKLFLSPNTVNTHRRNILEKTQKQHISDVIYDLTEQGLM